MTYREAEDMLDFLENHEPGWTVWPTWNEHATKPRYPFSTGCAGPYATESLAISAALRIARGLRPEILRLVLQHPDGRQEVLIETGSHPLARTEAQC